MIESTNVKVDEGIEKPSRFYEYDEDD